MSERKELDGSVARKEAARRIIYSHSRELANKYGTTENAGSDFTRWKPYHVVENSRSIQILGNLFVAAIDAKNDPALDVDTRTMFGDLHQDDLPAMLIAASLFYPSFEDLYGAGPSLALEKMQEAHVFRERDFAIVPAVIDAAIVKKGPEDPIVLKPIESGTPYAAHRKLFVDTMGASARAVPDTMYLVALLGVERLIENNAIHTVDGGFPRSLEEVIDPSTSYDSEVLRRHIAGQYQNIFRSNITYTPQLSTSSGELPSFFDNQSYFIAAVLPRLGERRINLAALLRDTSAFSRQQYQEHLRNGGGLLD